MIFKDLLQFLLSLGDHLFELPMTWFKLESALTTGSSLFFFGIDELESLLVFLLVVIEFFEATRVGPDAGGQFWHLEKRLRLPVIVIELFRISRLFSESLNFCLLELHHSDFPLFELFLVGLDHLADIVNRSVRGFPLESRASRNLQTLRGSHAVLHQDFVGSSFFLGL